MEEPEPQPRDRIVIARIAQIEESQDLLVDKIKPEKAVVFARTGVQRKRKIRRIAKRGQNVPRCRNKECNENTADGSQPLPGSSDKELLGHEKIEQSGRHGENRANQTFQQDPSPYAGGENKRPATRVRLLFVQGAQERPHRQRDGKR